MAVSLEEMMGAGGQTPGSGSAGGPSLPGTLSLQQMAGQVPSPKPGIMDKAGAAISSTAKEVAGVGKSYWSHFSDLSNAYTSQAKNDFGQADKQETIVGQIQSAAKGWLDLAGAVWSPVEAAVDTFASHPIQHAIDLAGEKIEKAAPDASTNPAAITKADVRRTVEGLKQFVDVGLQTAAGMVGGGKPAARMAGTVEKETAAVSAEEMAGAAAKEAETTIEPKAGGPAEKPHAVVVGKDERTGKPRVRAVTPEQAKVQISDAMRSGNEELRIPEAETPKAIHPALRDWEDIHGRMIGVYKEALESEKPLPAHGLLDQMIRHSDDGAAKLVLEKIRQYVDNIPVNFVRDLQPYSVFKIPETGTGLYRSDLHQVWIKPKLSEAGGITLSGAGVTRDIAHELVHAATVKFIRAFPDHQLVQELESLRQEAMKHLDYENETRGAETGFYQNFYGLTNEREFVSEAMSNPRFQKFLSRVQSGTLSLWNKLASLVGRMFGAHTPDEQNFLHRVMTNTEDLMRAQKRMAASGDHDVVAFNVDEDHQPITRAQVVSAARRIPGVEQTTTRLAGYTEELIRALSPETLGPAAKAAASVIARRVSELMRSDAMARTGSETRRNFWKSNPELAEKFIDAYEKGETLPGREMGEMRYRYQAWNHNIFRQDELNGVRYDRESNYLYHTFKNSDAVAKWFEENYGAKWGDPKFVKDRVFDLYKHARKAGFEPLFDNPEDIMLARQHASDLAEMQVQILKDLEQWGLAKEVSRGAEAPKFSATRRRAPNGTWYWVDNQATQVLHNAFDTTSLWSAKGLKGDLFRSAMALKNSMVPIRLALSAFHPLHVIHIDNAAATARAWKEMLAGTRSPLSAFRETVKSSLLYRSFWENPRIGGRLIKVWDGKVPADELTAADTQSLRNMLEGGFTPHLSQDFKTGSMEKFRDALRQHSVRAAWHAPFAFLDAMRYPIFDIWIPNLKAASYNREAEALLRARPELAGKDLERQIALRRIAKSIDNRYGEMNYNSLFWPRWFKDLMVANTLSLGWQMGFLREYGGGALDVGQFLKGTDRVQRVKSGALDRPLFVLAYTSTALAYGGLMTWAMTGRPPSGIADYVFPQTGEKNPDGSPKRVNTMFYTREFAGISKHMEDEGVLEGLGKLASSKASGLIGLASELTSGVNSFGQEIRDPASPAYRKVEQTLAYALSDLEPISTQAMKGADAKGKVLSALGFTPAPKYLTETPTEGQIRVAYGKYVQPKETPFERLRYGSDFSQLKQSYASGSESFGADLDKFMEQHQLQPNDRRRIFKALRSDEPPSQRMFAKLPWEVQKRLLDHMTAEDRETYVPISNKAHLRHRYEAPAE